MNVRIINAPTPEVLAMLERRLRPEQRERLREERFASVGLVHAGVVDLFYFADLAGKAAPVFAAELYGSCPQNVSALAVFGETAAVRTAMRAIEIDGGQKRD